MFRHGPYNCNNIINFIYFNLGQINVITFVNIYWAHFYYGTDKNRTDKISRGYCFLVPTH